MAAGRRSNPMTPGPRPARARSAGPHGGLALELGLRRACLLAAVLAALAGGQVSLLAQTPAPPDSGARQSAAEPASAFARPVAGSPLDSYSLLVVRSATSATGPTQGSPASGGGSSEATPNRARALAGIVRLGFLGPLTGPAAQRGLSCRRGIELALRDAGATACFELVCEDDAGDEVRTGQAAVKLAHRDGVVAILGAVDGASAHVAARIAMLAGVPLLAPAATEPLLTRLGNAWLFRNRPDAMTQEFVRHYTRAFRSVPDALAARSYDAAMLVIAAVRQVGADRTLVREILSRSHDAGDGARERPPGRMSVRGPR